MKRCVCSSFNIHLRKSKSVLQLVRLLHPGLDDERNEREGGKLKLIRLVFMFL